MIHMQIGYQCGDGLHCDKYKQCKYRAKWYKFHNLSVTIHDFFEYRLHIYYKDGNIKEIFKEKSK